MSNELQNIVESITKRHDHFLAVIEKELRPIIERKALACKCDMCNTQHSLGYRGNSTPGKRFNDLDDFLAKIESEFKLGFYFEVDKGTFNWF